LSDALLATKLHIPPLRSNIVNRYQLIQRLNDGIAEDHRLALISAPAGYGKSTLLSEWVSQVKIPVAWFSLEKGENAPERFWSYFAIALSNIPHLRQVGICEAFLQSLQKPQPPPMEELLTQLINDLVKSKPGTILILDDLHFITNSQIHRDLIFLIDHLPQSPNSLHLVISSRMDPPWPLARWRARGELAELRSTDLRFSYDEVFRFFNRLQQFMLSEHDISLLYQRTEGWIAGLQMASLSIKGLLKAQGPSAVSRFVESFTGSHRFILDYLMDEVISQQPAELRDFLYRTSILVQMTASLCEAITERRDSQEVLYQLEQANLFLIQLDDDRQWFRYHHLFAELLNKRLKQLYPDQIDELHRRASKWYAENNVLSEAIIEALKANDISFVNELVSGNTLAIVEHNELLVALGHFEEIPDKEISQKPWLCVAYAWVKAYADPTTGLDSILQRLENLLADEENDPEKQRFIGHLTAIRAYVAWVRGEAEQALEFSDKALEYLPESDISTRCHALHTQGAALQYMVRLPEAITAFEAAITVGQKTGRLQEILLSSHSLAFTYYLQGRLKQAFSVCQQILEAAKKSDQGIKCNSSLAPAYSTISLIQLEWNEVDIAIASARKAVDLAGKWRQADTLHFALNTLSQVLGKAGKLDEALEISQNAMRLAENVSSWFSLLSLCNEIQLYLSKGDISAATQRFKELEPRWDEKTSDTFLLTKALLLYEQGFMADLLPKLKMGIVDVMNRGETFFLIKLLSLQAVTFHALGQDEEALSSIGHCLDLAEPEGYVHTFAERGAPMLNLLRLTASRGIHTSYITTLIPAFGIGGISQKSRAFQYRNPLPALLEPLSERELQILRLLDSSLTSVEIGRELYLSQNTIRTHIRNIYSKLSVHGRIEAIRKAKELDLL
jgi:LuxR family maltose regulon positive regulatory protein